MTYPLYSAEYWINDWPPMKPGKDSSGKLTEVLDTDKIFQDLSTLETEDQIKDAFFSSFERKGRNTNGCEVFLRPDLTTELYHEFKEKILNVLISNNLVFFDNLRLFINYPCLCLSNDDLSSEHPIVAEVLLHVFTKIKESYRSKYYANYDKYSKSDADLMPTAYWENIKELLRITTDYFANYTITANTFIQCLKSLDPLIDNISTRENRNVIESRIRDILAVLHKYSGFYAPPVKPTLENTETPSESDIEAMKEWTELVNKAEEKNQLAVQRLSSGTQTLDNFRELLESYLYDLPPLELKTPVEDSLLFNDLSIRESFLYVFFSLVPNTISRTSLEPKTVSDLLAKVSFTLSLDSTFSEKERLLFKPLQVIINKFISKKNLSDLNIFLNAFYDPKNNITSRAVPELLKVINFCLKKENLLIPNQENQTAIKAQNNQIEFNNSVREAILDNICKDDQFCEKLALMTNVATYNPPEQRIPSTNSFSSWGRKKSLSELSDSNISVSESKDLSFFLTVYEKNETFRKIINGAPEHSFGSAIRETKESEEAKKVQKEAALKKSYSIDFSLLDDLSHTSFSTFLNQTHLKTPSQQNATNALLKIDTYLSREIEPPPSPKRISISALFQTEQALRNKKRREIVESLTEKDTKSIINLLKIAIPDFSVQSFVHQKLEEKNLNQTIFQTLLDKSELFRNSLPEKDERNSQTPKSDDMEIGLDL